MFAFAIWDTRSGSLLLGKEHMGQKPLFFYRDGQRFLFASEIRALMASDAVPRRLDPNSLWHYLSLRSMPDECSLIAGVHKLPAAHTLMCTADGAIRTRRYWTPEFRTKLKLREDETEEALDECLREVVASHLLSDVPVGSKRPFRDVYRSGSWEVTVKGRRACSGAWQPRRDAFVLALGARSTLVGVGRGRNVTGRRRTVPSIVVG